MICRRCGQHTSTLHWCFSLRGDLCRACHERHQCPRCPPTASFYLLVALAGSAGRVGKSKAKRKNAATRSSVRPVD